MSTSVPTAFSAVVGSFKLGDSARSATSAKERIGKATSAASAFLAVANGALELRAGCLRLRGQDESVCDELVADYEVADLRALHDERVGAAGGVEQRLAV